MTGRIRGTVRAFSLIELLVVVLIVGVLLAITLPALRSARRSAKMERRLATHRQLSLALFHYATGSAGAFPFFMTPGHPEIPARFGGIEVPSSYFGTSRSLWANFIDHEFLPIPRQELEYNTPGIIAKNREEGFPDEYIRAEVRLSDTLFARPRFWEDPVPDEASLFDATHDTDLLSPSSKGLTWDSQFLVGQNAGAYVVAFGDASAAAVPLHVFGDWNSNAVRRPWGSVPFAVLATRGGLRGRDR